MSWFVDIITSVATLVRGSRKPAPARFNGPHSWRAWKLTKPGDKPGLIALDPPVCAYCGQEQTTATHYAPCPGPAIEAQR